MFSRLLRASGVIHLLANWRRGQTMIYQMTGWMPAVHKIKGLVARDSNNKGSIAQESIFKRANSAILGPDINIFKYFMNLALENFCLKFPRKQALNFFRFMPALNMQSWMANEKHCRSWVSCFIQSDSQKFSFFRRRKKRCRLSLILCSLSKICFRPFHDFFEALRRPVTKNEPIKQTFSYLNILAASSFSWSIRSSSFLNM